MKFGKQFSLLAAVALATAFVPAFSAQAQDKSGCTLSADDCKLIATAETNVAKENVFYQDFELTTSTSVGSQQTGLSVTGKGPLSHDVTSTDFLNAYQLQLDLTGSRKGSANDTTGNIGLVLTGGALYFKTDVIPWTGLKIADMMSMLGSGAMGAGGTGGAGAGGLMGGMGAMTGGLDPTQILGLLGFSNTFAAIVADPNSKDFLKQEKTSNTPTLEDQKMSEFLYTIDLKKVQSADVLGLVKTLVSLGGGVAGGSVSSMSDDQFQAFLASTSADSSLTVTRWVGQTDNEYHALGLDLKMGFKPQAGANGGAALSLNTHFLIKLTKVGQAVTINPPAGAKIVDLQALLGAFGGMMGGAGGGITAPGGPTAPQATITATVAK